MHQSRVAMATQYRISWTIKSSVAVLLIVATTLAVLGYTKDRALVSRNKRENVAQDVHSIFRTPIDGLPVAMVTVNTSWLAGTVDERFLSVGSGIEILNSTTGNMYNSTRFWTVARGLAPAVYRFGGAEADFTYFDDGSHDQPYAAATDANKEHNYGKLNFHNNTLDAHDWDNINEFTRSVGWDILFCLNALRRNGSSWDPTNAMDLVKYTVNKGYHVLWSLGNEPNGFKRKANISITPEQMADTFRMFRNRLNEQPATRGMFVVGPDTSSPNKSNSKKPSSHTFMNDFMKSAGNSTNATSFHFYYTNGRIATFQNLTNPILADLLITNIKTVQGILEKNRPWSSKIWISESGLTFGGGTVGLGGHYIAGMLMLDKFGVSARLGVDLIVQQNLAGQKSGLLDSTYSPRLLYWLVLYHKRLMGARVLDASKVVPLKTENSSDDFSNYIRIYAHCTKASFQYPPGPVTLMIINMLPFEGFSIALTGSMQNSTIHEYLFLPIGLQGVLSPHAVLNGQRLKMTDDLVIPYHSPRLKPAGSTIYIPQLSYGFYVLPEVQAPACL